MVDTTVKEGIEKLLEAVRLGTDLTEGLNHEVRLFGECFGTDDFKEGTSAFIEKRDSFIIFFTTSCILSKGTQSNFSLALVGFPRLFIVSDGRNRDLSMIT